MVTRYGIVLEMSLYYTAQPLTHYRDGFMQAIPKLASDLAQFRLHALPHGLPQHDESPVPGSVARVRKTQEVERLGLPFSTALAIPSGVPPELDQARFVGVQFQVKRVEPVPQVCQKTLGIFTKLETHCEVVGKPDDDYIATSVPASSLVGP